MQNKARIVAGVTILAAVISYRSCSRIAVSGDAATKSLGDKSTSKQDAAAQLRRLISAERLSHSPDLDLSAFFQQYGRTAKSLSAAFYLTFDQKYVGELRQFVDVSPIAAHVVACAIYDENNRQKTTEDRLHAASAIIHDSPNDMRGYLLAFAANAQIDDDAAAKSFVESMGKSDLTLVPDGLTEGISECAFSLGLSSDEADILAHTRMEPSIQLLSQVREGIKKVILKGFSKETDSVESVEIASHVLRLNAVLTSAASHYRPEVASQGIMTELALLKRLPPTTEFGKENYTVADRMLELNENYNAMGAESTAVRKALANSSKEQAADYYKLLRREGREKANALLLGDSQK